MPSPPTPATAGDSPGHSARHQTGLITIVFTDLVGSTALKQQMGDRAGAGLIQQHHGLVRELLRGFQSGEEIETAGDSFLIVFSRPSDAVHFGLMLHARLRAMNRGLAARLEDRIGIHVGEVVIREQDGSANPKGLSGIQVDTCARLMDLAKGGQILLTRSAFDNARQILKGEDVAGVGSLAWLNHGSYLLKGIEASLEVCEVGEVGNAPLQAPAGSEKAQRQVTPEGEAVLGWRPAVGQLVPSTRWRLETKLGEGGFGEVWLGRHQHTKEQRVFKFCFQAERVRFLKREMTLFRLLKERVGDHPNIVRLHDVMLDHPPFYVEMDYVEGAELRSWTEQHGGAGAIPLATRLEIVAQAADGLQAAHEAGIIHRDIKPANILTGGKGIEATDVRVKLTDFGIGQVVSEEYLAGITRAGFTQTMMSDSSSSQTGTQLYMAPELLSGKPASTRADIYSLGVVLYQLLVADFSRPVTTDWARHVPDSLLREDLARCFAGDPSERFGSAVELAKNLRQLPQRRAELDRQQAELAARERAAYRRGIMRAAAVAVLVVAAFGLLALYAFKQAARADLSQRAEKQLRIAVQASDQKAQAQARAARRIAYSSDMNLVQQALAVNNLRLAQTLLNRQKPQPDQPDLRDWEWRYLWSQTRADDHDVFLAGRQQLSHPLSFSADGRLLVREEDGQTVVTDLISRRTVLRRANASLPVFLRHGATLAFVDSSSSATDDVITLLDIATQKETQLVSLSKPAVWFGFTPDDRRLLTVSRRLGARSANAYEFLADLRAWDVDTGKQLWQRAISLQENYFWRTYAISPDGAALAVVLLIGRVQVLETQDGRERFTVQTTQEGVTAVTFSPDSSTLLTGSGFADSAIRLWDAHDGKAEGSLEGHRSYVSDLLFTPDAKLLLSSSGDQTIRLWDWSTRQPAGVLRGHLDEVYGIALAPDGRTLASRCKDGSIYFWDVTKATRHLGYQTVPARLNYLMSAVFTPDSRSILAAELGGGVALWDAHTLKETRRLWGDSANGYDVIIFPDAGRVLRGDSDGRLHVWDVPSGRETTNFMPAPGRFAASITGNGKFLATLSGPATHALLETWDTDTWQRKGSLALHSKSITDTFTTSRPNSFVVAADGVLNFFDVSKLDEAPQQIESGGAIDGLVVSPDGRTAAGASDEGFVRLWDMATLQPTDTLRGFLLGEVSVAFSPDGRRLAAGGNGPEAVTLWDAETHHELLTLNGDASIFKGLKFSPDGRYLLAINPGGLARLWSAPSWAEIEAAEAVENQGRRP